MRDEDGHTGDEEPEAESAKLVEEGEGALDFLDFGDGDFIGDAVTLDYAEGVGQFAIAEFNALVTDVDGVARAIDELVLVYVNAVRLEGIDIDRVLANVRNQLRYLLGAPTPDEG